MGSALFFSPSLPFLSPTLYAVHAVHARVRVSGMIRGARLAREPWGSDVWPSDMQDLAGSGHVVAAGVGSLLVICVVLAQGAEKGVSLLVVVSSPLSPSTPALPGR
jgi:hypothetical protein